MSAAEDLVTVNDLGPNGFAAEQRLRERGRSVMGDLGETLRECLDELQQIARHIVNIAVNPSDDMRAMVNHADAVYAYALHMLAGIEGVIGKNDVEACETDRKLAEAMASRKEGAS